jgi:hypothetical protein
LGHESINHAVKSQPVIKPISRQLGNLRDMLRRKVRAQIDHDIARRALIRIDRKCECLGHDGSFCKSGKGLPS